MSAGDGAVKEGSDKPAATEQGATKIQSKIQKQAMDELAALATAIGRTRKQFPPDSGDPTSQNYLDFLATEQNAFQTIASNQGRLTDDVKLGFIRAIAEADNVNPKRVDQVRTQLKKDLLPIEQQEKVLEAAADSELDRLQKEYTGDKTKTALLTVNKDLKELAAINNDASSSELQAQAAAIIKDMDVAAPAYTAKFQKALDFKRQKQVNPVYQEYLYVDGLKTASAVTRLNFASALMQTDTIVWQTHPELHDNPDILHHIEADSMVAHMLERQALKLTPDGYEGTINQGIEQLRQFSQEQAKALQQSAPKTKTEVKTTYT
jgi:hypothetical protein